MLLIGEALEKLAYKAGLDLSKYIVNNNPNKNFKQENDLREKVYSINKDVAMYYHKNLINELEKKEESIVRNYLKRRNLTRNDAIKFGLRIC